MLLKILGILDIFIGICFWIFSFSGIISYKFMFILGLILLIKGVIFGITLNIASILDVVSALIILINLEGMPKLVILLVVAFLVQKGIFSLASEPS